MYNQQETAIKIKKIAKERKTPIKTLLEKCDLNINYISDLSKGNDTLISNIYKIANCLDVSIDYLVGRTGEPINKQIINSTVKGTQIQSEIIQTQEQTKDGALKDIEDIYNNLSLDEKIKFLQAIQPFKKSAEVDKN